VAGTRGVPILRTCASFLLILACAAAPAAAGTVVFQGTFGLDDQVQEFLFTISAPATVTLETFGYAGGTVGATTILPGGFDPTLALFLPPTNDAVLSSPCGPDSATDPNSHACEDAFFQQSLLPGSYIVALMVNDNTPLGGPDGGFANDGNPGFSCVDAGDLPGAFCDVGSGLGEPRSGQWALAIESADSAIELPEPGALSLAGIGMALAGLLARRRQLMNRRIG